MFADLVKNKQLMTKNILTISICALLTFSAPVATLASPMIEIMDFTEIDNQGIQIQIQNNVLHILGAAGQDMKIFNVAGVAVMEVKVDGDNKHYDLNLPRGCYIVKVGNVARKISLR